MNMNSRAPSAFARAIDILGGVAEASRKLGFRFQSYVSNALKRESCPSAWVLQVCRATGGQVTPHELRPDLYPDPDYRPALNPAPQLAKAA